MKIIIAGSRRIDSYEIVAAAVEKALKHWRMTISDVTEVVSGCAPGADSLGEAWALKHDIPLKLMPANWDMHGRSAGPIRNHAMASYADALVAVWNGRSPGTENMISKAVTMALPVYVQVWEAGEFTTEISYNDQSAETPY